MLVVVGSGFITKLVIASPIVTSGCVRTFEEARYAMTASLMMLQTTMIQMMAMLTFAAQDPCTCSLRQ